uniref:Uncharacterized protein n=1 Tax=Physcomitrium patens TaxID=3218 RepID=A0A2K1ITT7_PHYPA|nr:uncharacterized protein LOC112273009 isoform X1 [Physcomitrium patens]PNR32689.1 hypothetical protein PHYPA_024631 [Physcomitrium patens]|eukprot:XP_024357071.1 uncharacterized protein LOC112273009 isoform X1 [Physcomitrella patens]
MTTLLSATPFVQSIGLRSWALVGELRGLQGQKRLRVSSVQSSVSATSVGHGADDSDIADSQNVLQCLRSPLLNISPAAWIATFREVHDEAHRTAAAPTYNKVNLPSKYETTELHRGNRRRSEKTVIFTAEKAKRLRKENRATQTFHDQWYHSAIASRLATPEQECLQFLFHRFVYTFTRAPSVRRSTGRRHSQYDTHILSTPCINRSRN